MRRGLLIVVSVIALLAQPGGRSTAQDSGAPDSGVLALTMLEPVTEVERLLGPGGQWKPCRNMVIKSPDSDKAIEIRPTGVELAGIPGHSEAARFLQRQLERWPTSKLVKRYDVQAYDKMLQYYREPKQASGKPVLHYQQMDLPSAQDRLKTRTVSFDQLKILRYPQTWVDIWEQYVLAKPLAERLARVIEFDAAFRDQIENLDAQPDAFSDVEQSAYAVFYQNQYAFTRNSAPRDAEVYMRLAELHQGRENVDAELSVYLDAIRNEVPEPDVFEFRLRAGRIMVKRLRLYEDAIPHLQVAGATFAEATLLEIECYRELGLVDQELELANRFVEAIDGDSSSGAPVLTYPDGNPQATRDRALLFKARALLHRDQLKSAFDTFAQLSSDATTMDEADYLLASMLLYSSKYQEALQTIEKNTNFKALLAAARAPSALTGSIGYSPIGSRVLSLWGHARAEMTGSQGDLKEVHAALAYAKQLDPLCAEPFLADARAHEIAGRFPDAFDSYRAGLIANPKDPRLNYALGSLYQRAGVLDMAENHYNAALRGSPRFAAAMNGLGGLMMERAAAHNAEIQSLQNQPLDDESRAALTGALLGLSRSIREASAHYSASLDVNPSQPAVTVRLAGLYVQLAGLTNDGALVLSYLHRARELSQRGMQDAEEFGMTPRPAGSAQSARLAASAPPMEAFTIYAYASYEIGKRESKAALLEEARRALERVRTVGQDPRYFGDGEAMKAFKDSESFRWAMETLSAIAANERQVRKRDTFERTGTAHNLGNRWQLFPQGADQGFVDATRVEGGALVAAVRNQQEDMRVSRLGLREKFASVASVRVVIPALGDSSATRGVHLTRLADAEGGFTGAFDWSLMVGFDAENNLVWEVRAESEKTERSLMRDGKPVIIDPRQYGGDKLKAGDRVELTIDRFVPEPNGSTIRYEIELNGYRISINLLNALGNEEREPLDNANYVAEDGEGVMAIGFYVYGATGATGELKVDECEWVLDSNLARREDQD